MAIKQTSLPTQRGPVPEYTNSATQAVDQSAPVAEPSATTGQPRVTVVIPTLSSFRADLARPIEAMFGKPGTGKESG